MVRKKQVEQGLTRSSLESDPSRRFAGFYLSLREALLLSFLTLLVLLIYSNALEGPFLFDDVHNIKDNPQIRLTEPTLKGLLGAGVESPSPNRPVANISFALNYFFHRYNVLGYHLVNILIHIATGIFLYFFVMTTLSLPSLRSKYEGYLWIPLLAALLWLVHPIQTQSVTYIVQRMNSMAAMLYVLSLLLYGRARLTAQRKKRGALYAGCIIAGILSMGCKEITATLPFFIFLYEWFFFQDLSRAWLKRHFFPFLGILTLLVLMAWMYLGALPLEKIATTYESRDFTMVQRALTEPRVVILYLTLLIFPHPSRLNLDHDFPLSYSLFDPVTTLFAMGAIFGLVGLAICVAKKERLLSFCILWFFGNLVIESSVIGLEIIFEHRTYLPSMLFSLMAVTLAYRTMRWKRLRIGVLFAVVVLFSLWTYERNSLWCDDERFWRDCVAKSQRKARPHLNLGMALNRRGKLSEAIDNYYRALRIRPDYAEAHYNLGNVLARQGRLGEAIDHYSQAVRIRPHYVKARVNLGNALASQGKLREAMGHYSEALRFKPDDAEAHINLGNALARQGKFKQAISHYQEALRIRPDYAEAHYNMGLVLARQGKLEEAKSHFSKARQIKPHDAEARRNVVRSLRHITGRDSKR